MLPGSLTSSHPPTKRSRIADLFPPCSRASGSWRSLQIRILILHRLQRPSCERSVQRCRSFRDPRRTCGRLGAGYRTHGASFSGNAVAGWRDLSLARRGYAGGGITPGLHFACVHLRDNSGPRRRIRETGRGAARAFRRNRFALPASTQHVSRDEKISALGGRARRGGDRRSVSHALSRWTATNGGQAGSILACSRSGRAS